MDRLHRSDDRSTPPPRPSRTGGGAPESAPGVAVAAARLAPAGRVSGRHARLRRVWRYRAQYLAIAPFYVWFLAFGLYPLLYSLALSLHNWTGFGPWTYVGPRNYLGLLSDDVFWRSLANSLYFFVFMVPILTFGSLALAILLNAGAVRGRGPLRTVFFLPHITSTIIVSILFLSLLDDKYGWLNAGLQALGDRKSVV